jgi:hypothetical protein
MDSGEIIKRLTKAGWFKVDQSGDQRPVQAPDHSGPGDGRASAQGFPDRSVEKYRETERAQAPLSTAPEGAKWKSCIMSD